MVDVFAVAVGGVFEPGLVAAAFAGAPGGV
jgi:hypothetical protein